MPRINIGQMADVAQRGDTDTAQMQKIPFQEMSVEQFQSHLDQRSVNTHDPAAVASWFSDTAVQRIVPSSAAVGRAAIAAAMAQLFEAFPDFHLTVRDLFSAGRRICVECTSSGTHQGPYLGVEPTHRRIELDLCLVFRIGPDGLVEEETVYCDFATMLQQLGVLAELAAVT